MELANQLVLIGASLVVLSILVGLVSSRIGAPLLLVFLALGMVAGEDGPGGIMFDDFGAAYLIGSVSLAIILFDGGLRTRRSSFRLALWSALMLATVGVLVTAGITAVAAVWLLGVGWIEAMLVGSIVASTDAAAVFFLLHLHGLGLQRRVGATLEIESGINDPMAIFLTVACVELLKAGARAPSWTVAADFVLQMGGGAALGIAGGFGLLWLVNRLEIASGLYPILAISGALLLFAVTQVLGGSGYVAAYLAGLILGNHRHRAGQAIERFHDGLAWLSQIVMFLMLGLLVTPTRLTDHLVAALAIAAVLMFVARPIAVWLCLAPLRFDWRETTFIAWVGLRGAVPIFLATVPVLAGLPGARLYFDLAFVVVLVSLLCQGWTVSRLARALKLDLPPSAEQPHRVDIDLPAVFDRNVTGYTVGERSPAVGYGFEELPLPPRTRLVTVIRDGVVRDRTTLGRLEAGDYVLAVTPPSQVPPLDRLFAARAAPSTGGDQGVFGEFTFSGATPASAVDDLYNLSLPAVDRALAIGELLRSRIGRTVVIGDRLRVGSIELIVRDIDGEFPKEIGVELDPEDAGKRGMERLRATLRGTGRGLFRRAVRR